MEHFTRCEAIISTLPSLPLVVDLDGTLTPWELHWTGTKNMLFQAPWYAVKALVSFLTGGRVAYKQVVMQERWLPYKSIPLNEEVVKLISHWQQEGRPVCLATGSPATYATGLAAHLGCFDSIIASTPGQNTVAARKAQRLDALYGKKGYIYIGNSRQDIPVWNASAAGLCVGTPAHYQRLKRFFIEN